MTFFVEFCKKNKFQDVSAKKDTSETVKNANEKIAAQQQIKIATFGTTNFQICLEWRLA